MRNTSAAIILDHLYIMVKEKDNISDSDIKNQQYNTYLNNIDIIIKDINMKKTSYILLTKEIKEVIKSWRLELYIQSKEIIKIDIKEESLIKTQGSIKDKVHIHVTIE